MRYRKLLITIFALLGTCTFPAHAGWNLTSVRIIQMSNGNPNIFVYLNDKISHDDCGVGANKTVGGIVLKQEGSFSEIYARLLIAEQNGETIEILSSTGTCSSNDYWVTSPYIRFRAT